MRSCATGGSRGPRPLASSFSPLTRPLCMPVLIDEADQAARAVSPVHGFLTIRTFDGARGAGAGPPVPFDSNAPTSHRELIGRSVPARSVLGQSVFVPALIIPDPAC